MAKGRTITKITASDIRRRHPRYLTCETDRQYAQLANDIYELMHNELGFMEQVEIRNTCINLALYFEDLHSETHLFETFTRLYKRMFGMYVPFYQSVDANSPDAGLDAMKFMLWHSIVSERGSRVLNPTNDALAAMSEKLLILWNESKAHIDPNEGLADYLYAEETQEDVNQVKTVLVWLSLRCPLGRWFNNPDVKNDDAGLKELLPNLDKDTLEYANECHYVFKNLTWPLSLTPQRIYAEMIRLDMDDSEDPLAARIENIRCKPLGIYKILDSNSKRMQLQDFLGETFNVNLDGFFGDVRKLSRQYTHIEGSFITMDKQWEVNGPSMWLNPSQKLFDKYESEEREKHRWTNDFRGQYDWYINAHGGNRLYFFRNVREYGKWLETDLKLNMKDFPLPIDEDYPVASFFEDNGQMTLCGQANCIKHPANPYYDPIEAKEHALSFLCDEGTASPDMLLYMIQHEWLPDVLFNDVRGWEHGRQLAQDNLEFVCRCMRRDIKSEQVFRQRTPRTDSEEPDVSDRYNDKVGFEKFVELIAAEKSIRSKANKEWRIVRANRTTTVIRDVTKRQDYNISTHDLYEAHLNLGENEIQVAALIPYVGRQNAPAASALLYNIVGRGQSMNQFRKFAQQLFEKMREK
jgi:hypothetical protein